MPITGGSVSMTSPEVQNAPQVHDALRFPIHNKYTSTDKIRTLHEIVIIIEGIFMNLKGYQDNSQDTQYLGVN